MNLYTNCTRCKEEIPLKSNASTRTDLEREKGELIEITCSSCGENQEKQVNDIRAKPSTTILIGGLAISLITTVLLWNLAGLVGTITLIIPLMIWRQQQNSVHAFNSYLRKRW